ncbi:MAG: DUF1648 domain-containing protein [Dehalococcoidia bacterium]|nr:DUF1648 domain-containing protein [Dehalococcoidia bacterium]
MKPELTLRQSEVAALALIVASAAVGAYFYPQLPERIASHWNAAGQVDGYMSKFAGLVVLPLVSFGVLLLLIAVPRVDPLRANIEVFRRYYDWLVVLLIAFLSYVYLLTIIWNLGAGFDILQFLAPAIGVLFYFIGALIGQSKRNWSIGIRTPWTLSSDRVWEETHKVGGKLFKVAGLVAVLGVFFPQHTVFFIIVPVLLVAAYTTVFSYVEYRKEVK